MNTYKSLVCLYLEVESDLNIRGLGFEMSLLRVTNDFNLTDTDLHALRAIHQIVLLHRN